MRVAVLAALALVMLSGCPKERRALNAARKAVELSAETVAVVDVEVAAVYTATAEAALAECENAVDGRACYAAATRGASRAVQAVKSAKLSLLAIQSALDAWEAGSPNGRANFREAAGCFLHTLIGLDVLLGDLGINLPNLTTTITVGLDLLGFDESAAVCPGTP